MVIVGESKLRQAVDKAVLQAEEHGAKELNVSPKEVDQAIQESRRGSQLTLPTRGPGNEQAAPAMVVQAASPCQAR